jgi:Periplasmic copper-binding protein (NosD)
VVRTDQVNLPDYVNAAAPSIPYNATPSKCTPATQMPDVVDRTITLCADQVYTPFRVDGSHITIYGDAGGTASIHAPARAFGITVTGSDITITGVHIEADTDPADMNIWLCLYENCTYKGKRVRGAATYGGGILLDHTTNVTVVSSTVSKGTIGVASVHGSNNKIINNNLSNLNGWGAFLSWSDNNAVVGNTLNNVTRSCMGPDGASFTTGCESAGIAAVKAQANLIVNNHCERSSNCVYASGDGGFSSNNNKFFNNYCAASPHNCYEITFSSGNKFDYNVATSDPNSGAKCTYPFWISGSTVEFGQHNNWNCKFTAKQAFTDSQHATQVNTSASGF